MKRVLVVGFLALALAGCGEPKLDGSSQEALKKSVEAISQKLTPEQKLQFLDDMTAVAAANANLGDMISGSEGGTSLVLRSVDGKTREQIAAEADTIRKNIHERQRAQALSELADLKAKKDRFDSAQVGLDKFQILKSAFYIVKGKSEYDLKPFIELTVENGTGASVSRAYFRAVISTPGRSVPWFAKDFNYAVRGGIEPGETQPWTMALDQYSDWAKVTAPEGAVFHVEVVRLDGADGKPLFNSKGYTTKDAARLAELQRIYPN